MHLGSDEYSMGRRVELATSFSTSSFEVAKKMVRIAGFYRRVCHFLKNRARLVSAVSLKQSGGRAIPLSAEVELLEASPIHFFNAII